MISILIPYSYEFDNLDRVLSDIEKLPNDLDVEYIFVGHTYDNHTDDKVMNLIKNCDDKAMISIKSGENERLSSLINDAMKKAKGKYFAFLYPGDGIFTDGFEEAVRYINSGDVNTDLFLSNFSVFDPELNVAMSDKNFPLDEIKGNRFLIESDMKKISHLSGRAWVKRELALKVPFNENSVLHDLSTLPLWYGIAKNIFYLDVRTYKKYSTLDKEEMYSINFYFTQVKRSLQYVVDYTTRHRKSVKTLEYAIFVCNRLTNRFINAELKGECPEGYVMTLNKIHDELVNLQGKKYNSMKNDFHVHKGDFKRRKIRLLRPIIRWIYWFREKRKDKYGI